MTEDEAKTRWCPFARTVEVTDGNVVPGTSHNREHFENGVVDTTHPNSCIASDCMAWQWDNPEVSGNKMDNHGNEAVYSTGSAHGYCGLARR